MDSSIVAQISAPLLISDLATTEAAPKPRCRPGLVYGVGITDTKHAVTVGGRPIKTYDTWAGVLERCYSAVWQARRPTYIGCTVEDSWLHFSVFERWMLEQDYVGKELDKDLLIPGNKIYSADTCVFVTRELNLLLSSGKAYRGKYPLGVSYRKDIGKYSSKVSKGGKLLNLGYHSTALEAHRLYQLAKADIIAEALTDNPRIRAALDKRVVKLREDAANGRITESI